MRFTELEHETLTERQNETHDHASNWPQQGVHGPIAAWVRSTVFADRAETMGGYLRISGRLPERIIELAALMVAKTWRANFVWQLHKELALESGIAEDAIDAIQCGRVPQFESDADFSAYRFLVELLDEKRVSDETWLATIDQFDEQGVVDLLDIAGYWVTVVMAVVATGLGADLSDPFVR